MVMSLRPITGYTSRPERLKTVWQTSRDRSPSGPAGDRSIFTEAKTMPLAVLTVILLYVKASHVWVFRKSPWSKKIDNFI